MIITRGFEDLNNRSWPILFKFEEGKYEVCQGSALSIG